MAMLVFLTATAWAGVISARAFADDDRLLATSTGVFVSSTLLIARPNSIRRRGRGVGGFCSIGVQALAVNAFIAVGLACAPVIY